MSLQETSFWIVRRFMDAHCYSGHLISYKEFNLESNQLAIHENIIRLAAKADIISF